MAKTWINEENMLVALKDQMNAEMMAAAEPVIRKAVEEAATKAERDRLTEANSTRYEAPAAQPSAQKVPAPVGHIMAPPVEDDNGHYIRLGEINQLLGFTVTAEFLAGLGFVATREKNAMLYRECDVPALCRAIIAHVASVPERMQAGKLKAA